MSNENESERERTRTYSWARAAEVADKQVDMTGLDNMRAICAGETPPAPMAQTVGWKMTAVEKGGGELRMKPAEFHLNPHVVHGGALAAMLDSATALAVISTLDVGERCTSLEIKINFVRAVTLDVPEIIARSRIVHSGRQTAVAEAEVVDEAGKLYARASATFLKTPRPTKAA